MKRNRALPLTITLGSILVVFTLVLTTLWNIVLVYNTLRLKPVIGPAIWQQWVILGVGSFLFVVIITGITLFIIFMSRQIIVNQMQKNFIDSVTHELKTPMTSLRLYVETLQRHELSGEKKEKFLQHMLQDLEYLDTLVSHVLEAARSEVRQQNFELLELDPLIEDCRQLVLRRYQLDESCIQTQTTGLTVESDPHGLRLVLVNLLDNAVKYSPAPPQVRVRAGRKEQQLEIEVQDQGYGILPQERKRIFNRFYRGSLQETTKGTGLGLFIVHETVKQLKGQIVVESGGRQQGSTFRVCLPLEASDS